MTSSNIQYNRQSRGTPNGKHTTLIVMIMTGSGTIWSALRIEVTLPKIVPHAP